MTYLNAKVTIVGVLGLLGSNMQALTITTTLNDRASIDIFVSKNAIPNTLSPIFTLLTHKASVPLANYSYFINQNNETKFWKTLFNSNQTANTTNFNLLYPASSRVAIPSTVTSPLTVELSPDDITLLLGEPLSQVYVIVQQRTYYFDTQFHVVAFFSNQLLTSQLYCTTDTINVQASGNINQTMWDAFPESLKTSYAIAVGSVS